MNLITTAIQFAPRMTRCRADVLDNQRRSESLIHEAGKFGPSLIVFPELCMTGYSFLSKEEAYGVCETVGGVTGKFMSGVAESLKAYVAWGFMEVDEVDGSLYNSVSVADPAGNIVITNRKANLWGNDFLWAKPGQRESGVVETDFGFLTGLVCRDLRGRRPANMPRTASTPSLLTMPVDVVAAPVNWGKGGFPAVAWMDFASANDCTLVIANRWGKEKNGGFEQDFGMGGSIVVEPNWNVHMGGLKFGADCVVSASLEVSSGKGSAV